MYSCSNILDNILKSIYVIEDDPSISSIIKIILEREGYDVKTFDKIKSALPITNNNKPDLLIMDINFPEGKYAGIKFLQHIQKEIPTIMITGYDNIHTRTESAIYGAKYYLKKPLDPSILVKQVKNAIIHA